MKLKRYKENFIHWLMIKTLKYWVNHYMDQWEMFQFKDDCGNDTYITISYGTEWPFSFAKVD